jgi:hypothetical protein
MIGIKKQKNKQKKNMVGEGTLVKGTGERYDIEGKRWKYYVHFGRKNNNFDDI